jgi:serine/threonine-protein kinase
MHMLPDVLPGGEAALFNIVGANGARLAVVTLATGAITDLKVPGIDPTYVPTGHIVFATAEGTLQAIGFDPERLAVTSSAPVQVLENVVTRPDVAQFALAANGSLVYTAGSGDAIQRTLVWVDRNGRKEPIGVTPRLYSTPRLSPDGTRAAVVIDGDIWVTELARPGTLRRVTTDPARERFPLWTPDSQRLLFESNKGGNVSIVSKAADGRGEETLILRAWTQNANNLLSPEAWFAEGQELVFIYRGGPGNFDIGRVPVDGSGKWLPVLNTDASESSVAMSPDGRRIAYEADDTGQLEIYVEEFPRLGNRQIVSTGGGTNPLWSRDGRQLFYRRTAELGGGIMMSPIQTAPVFSIGTGREVFGGSYYQVQAGARQWDIASDGRFLMQESVDDETARPQLILVRNWVQELRRLVR